MKYTFGVALALLVGGLIGFFGVLVSVFADSPLTERLVTIGIIVLIYIILSGTFGFLLPEYSWKWGLLTGSPGVLILGVYMLREYNPYYLVYIVLIICLACLGAWGGSSIRNRGKK